MVLVEQGLFTKDVLDTILGLPEVVASRGAIDGRVSGSVYFSADLSQSIKDILHERLALDLSEVGAVPMRWIKGDIAAHEDRGAGHFENTYLVYLTDSGGELLVDGTSYPISQGYAYVFSEGLRHETMGTGNEPRLLIGPMSETGFAVGGPSNYYIRQNADSQEYSYDLVDWYEISWPFNVYATTIEFTTDISLNDINFYFVCNNPNMTFGSDTLKEDGTRPKIYIDSVLNYPGLIRNGAADSDGYSDVNVYNLEVKAVNGSTLASGGGWIGQEYFGKGVSNSCIINCSSEGDISDLGGGIVGQASSSGSGSTLYIRGCSSNGAIGQYGGGIVGHYAGENSGSIICESCWSEGVIGQEGGGIYGDYAGVNTGSAVARNCYSTGLIQIDGGGIFGANAGESTGSATADACYGRGILQSGAGGIFGSAAAFNFGTTVATNCYSFYGTNPDNGIYGGSPAVGAQKTNCYSANGSWSNTSADLLLTGVPNPIIGTTWVNRGVDQPYELLQMGYSPYTRENINGKYLVRIFESGRIVGGNVNKDMDNEDYTDEFDPYDYQEDFFPGMADFIDENILAGDKDEGDRLIASFWDDLGNDVFDDWGYFYLYDVTTGKYYFPLLSPQNEDNGILTTQTFNVFGRTFTVEHGWSAQGIFKLDISVADSLPFRFGAYGNMGSDANRFTADYTETYTINNTSRTLYYRLDEQEGDDTEILFTYFIPKNQADNASQPYNVYYIDDNMSMVTNPLTTGITIYFAKKTDVKVWVTDEIKIAANNAPSYGIFAGSSTDTAIIPGRNYTKLDITGGDVGSYSTISVDSTTGKINTTANTVPGLYTLYIRNTGSYFISQYRLSIITQTEVETTCCDRRVQLCNGHNDINGSLIAGNALAGGVRYKPISYGELIRIKMALNSKR